MIHRPVLTLLCICALSLTGCAHAERPVVLTYGALPNANHWTYAVSPAEGFTTNFGGGDISSCLPGSAPNAGPGSEYLVELGHAIRTDRTRVSLESTDALQPNNPIEAERRQRSHSTQPVETLRLSVSQLATGREVFRAVATKPVRLKPRRAGEPLSMLLCRVLRGSRKG